MQTDKKTQENSGEHHSTVHYNVDNSHKQAPYFKQNRNYFAVSVYAFVTGLLLIFAFLMISNIDVVQTLWVTSTNIVTPFVWGLAIAYILAPVLRNFEKFILKKDICQRNRRVTRGVSLLGTYVLAGVFLTMFFSIIIPEVYASITTLIANVTDNGVTWVENLGQLIFNHLADYGITEEQAREYIAPYFDYMNSVKEYVTTLISVSAVIAVKATAGLKNIFIALIVSIYMLVSKETFVAQSVKIVYALTDNKTANYILDFCKRTHAIFSGFIIGKIIDSIIVGFICFGCLSILGIEYTLLISLIIACTNLIPFFGPFIGAIPSVILLLTVSLNQALIFAVFILVLQLVDGYLIGPKILGESTGLTVFWVVFAVIVMGATLGIVGMFIGVPIFATIYMACKDFIEYRLRKKGMPTATDDYIN